MALPKFLQRKPTAPAVAAVDPTGDESVAVQQARVRARRRLIGAVVLLAVGVVVFPLVFETQPRPLATDVPIEVPRREGTSTRMASVPPRPAAEEPKVEAPPAAVPESVVSTASAPSAAPAPPPEPPADRPADKPAEKPAVKPADKPAEKPADLPTDKPAAKPLEPKSAEAKTAEARPTATDAAADGRRADAERARAALEGRAPAAAASEARGRFVVQVGAYTDPGTLRDVRAKVEKLGLKTYTQSVDTEAGRRTRVRVGPYGTRQEAESASAKLKGAGLPGNVLTL